MLPSAPTPAKQVPEELLNEMRAKAREAVDRAFPMYLAEQCMRRNRYMQRMMIKDDKACLCKAYSSIEQYIIAHIWHLSADEIEPILTGQGCISIKAADAWLSKQSSAASVVVGRGQHAVVKKDLSAMRIVLAELLDQARLCEHTYRETLAIYHPSKATASHDISDMDMYWPDVLESLYPMDACKKAICAKLLIVYMQARNFVEHNLKKAAVDKLYTLVK